MPGPEKAALEELDVKTEVEQERNTQVKEYIDKENSIDTPTIGHRAGAELAADMDPEELRVWQLMQAHYDNARGRAITIQAGLYGGLVGHGTEDALKVVEYDEDGTAHKQASTLDSFEHFWKLWVDFGLGLFALVNAGVKVEGLGAMTFLILASLIIGKFTGILLCYKIAKRLGFYPPLGIRTRHIYMIGLIASIGLIVAIFVSEVAFTNKKLQGDAKLGALLSALTAFLCFGIGRCVDYSHEDVAEQERLQIEEELKNEQRIHRPEQSVCSVSCVGAQAHGTESPQIRPTNSPQDSPTLRKRLSSGSLKELHMRETGRESPDLQDPQQLVL